MPTKDTEIICFLTDIRKKNCNAGTLKREKDSVIMQNIINHVNDVNRYIREGCKIKQSKRNAMPVKQHTEYHLTVKMVQEREQEQRKAGEQSYAGRAPSTSIFFVVVSIGWLEDEFVSTYVVAVKRIIQRWVLAKLECLMIHQRWTPERDVKM